VQRLPEPQPGEVEEPAHGPDLKQVKGQETAKARARDRRCGGHNLLMVGPPGAGKSLLAACLPGILPPLSPAEALEVSMVASVAGTLEGGRISRTRPFRAPHHSASMAALTGGGLRVRPGEVSLAHLGVLFLDELPEFQRAVLDSLRQPLETGKVDVARANAHVTYPRAVQLVAAMNPCRCGHLGDPRSPAAGAALRRGLPGAGQRAAARPHRPARRGRAGRRATLRCRRRPKGSATSPRASPRRARSRTARGIRANAELDGDLLDAMPRPTSPAAGCCSRLPKRSRLSARGYTRVLLPSHGQLRT
jgi:magnesium chelatase family protein